MDKSKIGLEVEVARVRGELLTFREVCLPAFFGRGGISDIDYPGPGIATTSTLGLGVADVLNRCVDENAFLRATDRHGVLVATEAFHADAEPVET